MKRNIFVLCAAFLGISFYNQILNAQDSVKKKIHPAIISLGYTGQIPLDEIGYEGYEDGISFSEVLIFEKQHSGLSFGLRMLGFNYFSKAKETIIDNQKHTWNAYLQSHYTSIGGVFFPLGGQKRLIPYIELCAGLFSFTEVDEKMFHWPYDWERYAEDFEEWGFNATIGTGICLYKDFGVNLSMEYLRPLEGKIKSPFGSVRAELFYRLQQK